MTPQERRSEFRKGLNGLYLPYYDQMCLLLDPTKWGPYFGLRSLDEQGKLYAQGRTIPGPIVTNAPPGSSAHNYGCATDWAYFENGILVWLDSHDPKWQEYFEAGKKAEVTLGAFWHTPDTDHNELKLAHTWGAVLREYNTQGELAANAFIEMSHELALEVSGASPR